MGNCQLPQTHLTDTLQLGWGASHQHLCHISNGWHWLAGIWFLLKDRFINDYIVVVPLCSSVPLLFKLVFLAAFLWWNFLFDLLNLPLVCPVYTNSLTCSFSDFDKTWGNDASHRCVAAFSELHWLAQRGLCNYWSKQVGIFLTDWSRGRVHHLWHTVALFFWMLLVFSPHFVLYYFIFFIWISFLIQLRLL